MRGCVADDTVIYITVYIQGTYVALCQFWMHAARSDELGRRIESYNFYHVRCFQGYIFISDDYNSYPSIVIQLIQLPALSSKIRGTQS